MRVNLYGPFRLAAGVRSLDLDLPSGVTIRQLTDEILRHAPILRSHWLDSGGELRLNLHIFVNHHELRRLPGGLETALQPGDTVDFFPPMAGG